MAHITNCHQVFSHSYEHAHKEFGRGWRQQSILELQLGGSAGSTVTVTPLSSKNRDALREKCCG